MEKFVEIPHDVVKHVDVHVDVPVEVDVPYPVEKIIERVVEQVVEVPGPTKVVEKIVEVEKVVEVEVEVERIREVEVCSLGSMGLGWGRSAGGVGLARANPEPEEPSAYERAVSCADV